MSEERKEPTVRMTIAVPARMREQMKAIGNIVNWSAIAAAAFGEELNRHAFPNVPHHKATSRPKLKVRKP